MKIVIIGAGQVGQSLAGFLCQGKNEVVVIEKDPAKCLELDQELDLEVFNGSGTNPTVLKQAGLDDAAMIVAVTDSDETNLMSVLVSSMYLPEGSTKMARIRNRDYLTDRGLKDLFKLDVVVNPEELLASKILRILYLPGARDVLLFEKGQVFVVAFEARAESQLINKSLTELAREFGHLQVMVGAILRQSPAAQRGRKVIIPGGKDQILEGDLVYYVATRDALDALVDLQGPRPPRARSILIAGGGGLSVHLASVLSEAGYTTRILIGDPAKAREASQRLDKALVIQSYPSELDQLEQILGEGVDTYIAACTEDAVNILTAQLARKLGIPRTVVVTQDPHYLKLIRAVDVDMVLNPFDLAAAYVLRNMHQVNVLEVNLFAEEDAEAFEFVTPAKSPLTDKPLKNIKFPRGTLMAMIFRGNEVIIPGGNDKIQADDRVIAFAQRGAVPALERLIKPGRW